MLSIGMSDHKDGKCTTKIKKTEGGEKRIKITEKATVLSLLTKFVG